ncbi:MAG: glycoside hydrolase [Symbiobacteriaceae bacterium]|nr:glycoside hydrolase [Symbiobacteriaceae bacterium]
MTDKKILSLALLGVLVWTLVMPVAAADQIPAPEINSPTFPFRERAWKAWDNDAWEHPPGEHQQLMTKEEDGLTYYSLDGGETWNELPSNGLLFPWAKAPFLRFPSELGLEIEGDAFFPWGELPKLHQGMGNAAGYTIKKEDGVVYYSLDGGESWSETPPEGLSLDKPENWPQEWPSKGWHMGGEFKFPFPDEEFPGLPEGGYETTFSLTIKVENGITYYSIDGGESWSETPPEGFTKFGPKHGTEGGFKPFDEFPLPFGRKGSGAQPQEENPIEPSRGKGATVPAQPSQIV